MIVALYGPEDVDITPVQQVCHTYRIRVPRYYSLEDVPSTSSGQVLIGLEATSRATPLGKFDWDRHVIEPRLTPVIITGSTKHGVPGHVLDQCDHVIRIEQWDDTRFLSPAPALAIVAHDFFQRTANKDGLYG